MAENWSISGKTVLITGGNIGIGKEAAIQLASLGAGKIILASRNLELTRIAAEQIKQASGNENCQIDCHFLDLSSLMSVKQFAEELLQNERALHVLINNAGVQTTNRSLSRDGHEKHFATNHLGHFFLTQCLMPLLVRSKPSRVVIVASEAYYMFGRLGLENLAYHDKRPYFFFAAYAQSKLCNVLHARELSRRLLTDSPGVTVYAMKPGSFIPETDLLRGWNFIVRWLFLTLTWPLSTSLKKAALGIVHCASEPGIEKNSGALFDNCKPVESWQAGKDDKAASALWDLSEELIVSAFTKGAK